MKKNIGNTILVIGGAGYVGCVLVRELLSRGFAVRVFDRLYFGSQGLAETRERVEVVVGDMRALPSEVLEGVSAVINLGGLSNDPTAEYNPRANYEMNTAATESLARRSKERGIERFLFASSCSIYDFGVGDDEKDSVMYETSKVDPRAAYSSSKFEAENILASLADERFCPVVLRKGTVHGFSPRMRYDLVVNTFVKDALSRGYLTVHYGGEMWRPLVDVRDVARAYILCLTADKKLLHNEVFNLVSGNYRVSELALRVRNALAEAGVPCELRSDYRYQGVRSYRVSGKKFQQRLDFQPTVTVEESVKDLVDKIRQWGYTDFDNPRYHNIRWMKLLEEANVIIKITGSVFDAPLRHEPALRVVEK